MAPYASESAQGFRFLCVGDVFVVKRQNAGRA